MLKRIKQFYGACNAEIKPAELKIIFDNLNEAEQKLFFAMAVQDQCHAINVFKTVLKIAKEYNSVDVTLLKKTALLHDVGRKNKEPAPKGCFGIHQIGNGYKGRSFGDVCVG